MAGTTADRAYDTLTASLAAGDLVPGMRLRESELAASMGMSRTPVREALRRLSAEGLTQTTAKCGVVVCSFTYAELDEIFAVRVPLEGYAARRCALRSTPTMIGQLAEICDEMESGYAKETANHYDLAKLNTAFHTTVYEAANSRPVSGLLSKVLLLPLVHYTFTRYSTADMERSMRHHRELIESFSAGDPDWAESVMQLHVRVGQAIVRRTAEELD